MKEVVNTKIKFREPFRPFAPVTLAEQAANYFATKNIEQNKLAPYMLMVSPIVADKQAKIQAVCHKRHRSPAKRAPRGEPCLPSAN